DHIAQTPCISAEYVAALRQTHASLAQAVAAGKHIQALSNSIYGDYVGQPPDRYIPAFSPGCDPSTTPQAQEPRPSAHAPRRAGEITFIPHVYQGKQSPLPACFQVTTYRTPPNLRDGWYVPGAREGCQKEQYIAVVVKNRCSTKMDATVVFYTAADLR